MVRESNTLAVQIFSGDSQISIQQERGDLGLYFLIGKFARDITTLLSMVLQVGSPDLSC